MVLKFSLQDYLDIGWQVIVAEKANCEIEKVQPAYSVTVVESWGEEEPAIHSPPKGKRP